MKLIGTNTKLVGLIGMPLGQSFAARMQNEAYEAMGLDYFYFPIELPNPEDLPKLLTGLRVMNFGGMAVTKPFKVEILNHLDEVEKTAEMIGSCNTIKIENGKWIGYNTDGVGAVRSLREEAGRDLAEFGYLSFGAGGAGRSVCFELAKAGAKKIVLVDVTDSCFELAESINKYFPGVAEGVSAKDTATVQAKVAEVDVLLNNSGLGMQPHLDKTPLPKEWIESRHICFDAVYNPLKTRFLLDAEEKGCKIINGLAMSEYQAARQVEIWTGITGSEEHMHRALSGILEEQQRA